MANNQNPGAAFMPDLNQGPFSDFLDPRYAQAQAQQAQQGIQVPNPNGRVPKAAAAAAIIDKFLLGYQSGRTRNYLMQEQQQQKQVGLLQAKITQIANDPTRTEEDKKAAIQPLYKAYGQIMRGAIEQGEQGQQDGKKGKKKNQGEQQPQGVGGHVLGMFKDFATGLAGGQFPKELDAKTVKDLVGHALVDSDTALAGKPTIDQLSAGIMKDVHGVMETARTPPGALYTPVPGSAAEAPMPSQEEMRQRLSRLQTDPRVAKLGKGWWAENVEPMIAGGYQPAPKPGSTEAVNQAIINRFGNRVLGQSLSMEDLGMLRMGGNRFITKEGNIVVTDPATNKSQRMEGIRIAIPSGPNAGERWYARSEDGTRLNPVIGQVQESGIGTPPESKLGQIIAAPKGAKDASGNPLPEGIPVRYGTVGEETGYFRLPQKDLKKGPELLGNAAPPGSLDVWGRPLNPNQVYVTGLDEQGAPRTYIPKAMQAEYKMGLDDEGRPYAIPVPRYTNEGQPNESSEQGPRAGASTSTPKSSAESRSTKPATPGEKAVGRVNPFSVTQTESTAQTSGTSRRDSSVPPGAIPLGSSKATKLSAQGTKGIEQIDTAMQFANGLKELLEQKDKDGRQFKDENTAWDKLSRLGSWAKYKAGFASELDDTLGQSQAFIALNEILSGLPYMQNRFNMQYLSQIQQHIPSPTDTPKMMYEKIQWQLKNLPVIKKSIEDGEATRIRNGQVAPPPGAGGSPNFQQVDHR